MTKLYLVAVICFNFLYVSHALIEEENIGGMVRSLQLSVQDLQGQVRALQNKSCGCATKSPVFMASLSADLVHCTLHQPVIFDSVKVNQGSGYDHNHGVFKAPVAGVYAFTATLSVIPHNQYHVAIVRGNANNEIGYLYTDPQNIWLERSTTVFTHLNMNEQVWMVCVGDSRIEGHHQHSWGAAGDYHSHFSGFLVTPDN